jgi:hypothetical protein
MIEKELMENLNVEAQVQLQCADGEESEKEIYCKDGIKINCIYVYTQNKLKEQIKEYCTQRYGCEVVVEEWS